MKRQRRLNFERLETREVPAGIWYAQNFDTTPVGALPSNWAQWSSDGANSFSASNLRSVSPAQSLVSSGTSARSALAWLNQAAPADLQVSANVYADSLVPLRLMLRGSDLAGSTPTYYAVTVTRGVTVALERVVDGAETSLAQLNSSSYTSGVWLRVTLSSRGFALTARIQRLDNGQYLNPSGAWTATATDAILFKDRSITAGGFVGISRPARYAGNVAIDDFQIDTFDSTPPAVTITAPGSGSIVTGVMTAQATAIDDIGVARVEFWLNGQLRATRTASPYSWTFDTTSMSNGPATLVVRAYDAAGNVGTASRSFVINNVVAGSGLDIPHHYSHIRVAELAYSGTPMTSFEQNLLQNSVDLVIPNEQYLSQIAAVAPNTPQLIYTNVSNLYGNLLTDWLAYADRTGLARENVFYHVTQATPFTGGSPSSQPVNWLWDVRRDSTNLTYAAHNTTSGDVTFGGSGQSLYLGYTDRFRELNFTLASGRANGWTGRLEYATAVDANGTPIAWSPLTTISDGSNGFAQSGRVTFNPPANWVPAKLNGSTSLYYVRVRTLTSGTAPVASVILGRDYVNSIVNPNGSISGTIPAFDTVADANHDGYLTDAEYAGRAAGKDARFFYESRLFYPFYGPMRFVINPAGTGAANWAADFNLRFLNANSLADGLFVDNSSGVSPVAGYATIESSANYASNYAALLGAVRQAVAPRWLMANTSGFYNETDVVLPQVQGNMEEFIIRALSATTAQFEDVAALVQHRQSLTGNPLYTVLDSLPTSPTPGVGSENDPTGRTQLATLAYYYMIANPQTTFLMMNGGYAPASSWTQHWSNAIAFNVGQAVGNWSVRATGADPSNTSLTYKVYQRTYSNALILYKPLSYRQGVGSGTAADNTATVHALNGSYRMLRNDGTLGPVITSVSLRNGEGAILIPA